MSTTITRRYMFEAAHFLPKVPEGHKCKRMHGHNYEIEVTCAGPINEVGFIVDFWDLDKVVDPLIASIDHRVLNDQAGLQNPTAENIGRWFLERIDIKPKGTKRRWSVTAVRVYETKNCWADVS